MTLRLDHLALDDLPPLWQAAPLPVPAAGLPLQLAIDSIAEDPDQPRTEFDEPALKELSQSIADRGVRTPISVRPDPSAADRWILNFGARRLRASRLAGKAEIPAYVDLTADSYDQVVENEQREGLSPLELALFVQKQMRKGASPGEIARRLGKSRGYLTFLGALIDAPDWLLNLYRSGRCRGITELYELRKLHDERPEAVDRWLVDRPHVSRADLRVLREELMPTEQPPNELPPGSKQVVAGQEAKPGKAEPPTAATDCASRPLPSAVRIPAENAKPRPAELALVGDIDGTTVRVLLDASVIDQGKVFVTSVSDSRRQAVALASIERLRLDAYSDEFRH